MYHLRVAGQQPGFNPPLAAATAESSDMESPVEADSAVTEPSYIAASSPAEAAAAARAPYIMRPGVPMAPYILPRLLSPGRRPKRIAVRGRVTPPAGLPSGSPALASGTASDAGAGEVGQLVASALAKVADKVLPSDIAGAVDTLIGGLRDWVWHGSEQKPKHLFFPLGQT